MKRRTVCLLSVFCLLLAMLAGCGNGKDTPSPSPTEESTPPQEQSGQLTLPVDSRESMHPALSQNKSNLTLAPLLYEGLFELDESFTPQMVLCRSYTCNEDATRWTFTLRSGVMWSDGTALTASDAASALNAARGSGSRFQKRLSAIQSVTAEGEDTVIVTLSSGNGALPALLDVPLAKDTTSRPAGTGPYCLVEGDAGSVLSLRDDWWQAGERRIGVDPIALMEITADEDLMYAFDTREADLVVADFTGSSAPGFSSDYAVWEFDTTNLVYLGFRAGGDSPCADSALRKAISLAIDRASLVSSCFAHHGKAVALPVSPASPLYDAESGSTATDNGAALKELTGKSRIRTLKLLVCSENTFKVSAADRIAARLKEYGLNVSVEKLPYDDYAAALSSGSFDLYLAEVAMTADFDPTALTASGRSLNFGGYADGTTDQLLAAFRASDEVTRPAAAKALYADLAEKTPIAPLCFKTGSVLTQWNRMSGLTPTWGNAFHGMEQWSFS